MAKQNPQQYSLKSTFLNRLVTSISLSLAISIAVMSVPAYWVLKHAISSDIKQIETVSNQAINSHLTSGWQNHNLEPVYQELHNNTPGALFLLQKAPQFLTNGDGQTQKSTTTEAFKQLITQVEKNELSVIKMDLLNGHIHAAFPITFQKQCLSCHSQQVQSGDIYVGALAGTLVLQKPLSIAQIPSNNLFALSLALLILFAIIVTIAVNKLVQNTVLLPLAELHSRLKHLNTRALKGAFNWQGEPQNLPEINLLGDSLTQHLQMEQTLRDKLDSLTITENESGLLHKERYHQVLRYEFFRSHRYHHPFSLILIKLIDVKVLNPTAKNIETESPGSKYMVFGQILHNDSRETDLAFRLEEKIFAIVAPETDESGAAHVEKDIYRRLTQSDLLKNIETSSVLPQYEFTIQVGAATYNEENSGPKELMKTAIEKLHNSTPKTGRYPPENE